MKGGAIVYRSQGEPHYGLVLMKNVKIMSLQRLGGSVINIIFSFISIAADSLNFVTEPIQESESSSSFLDFLRRNRCACWQKVDFSGLY